MVRPTIIDMNLVELKYYLFMTSLNKCSGSYNVLSPKICAPKETKDINVETFNMITNKDEVKAMTEHILFDYKCKFNGATCSSKRKWNNKTCKYERKNYHKFEKDFSWNPSTCICENSKYSKSVTDTSVTEGDEIVVVMNNLTTEKTNTIITTLQVLRQ